MSNAPQKTYPLLMAVDKPMAKIGFISFLLALWILIFYFDSGWFLTLLLSAPMTALVGMGLALVLEYVLEPLLRWIKK